MRKDSLPKPLDVRLAYENLKLSWDEINQVSVKTEKLNSIMLRYRTGLYIPKECQSPKRVMSANVVITKETDVKNYIDNVENRICAMNIVQFLWNIRQIGFFIDEEDIHELLTLEFPGTILQRMYVCIQKLVGADRNYKFFFSDMTFADTVEAVGEDPYFYALLHYMGVIPSARVLDTQESKTTRKPRFDEMVEEVIHGSTKGLTRLRFYPEIEFISILDNLITSNTPLSTQMEEDVLQCMKYFYADAFGGRCKDILIPCKSTLALVFNIVLDEHLPYKCLLKNINNATDVLRIYAVYSGCPADLVDHANLKFKNHLNGFERVLFMDLLTCCKHLESDIARYPELWKRAFERIKPSRFKAKKYERIVKVHHGLCNKDEDYPKSLNAAVARVMNHAGDSLASFKKGLEFLEQFPGIYLRNFDKYVRSYGNKLSDDRDENLHFITMVCTSLQKVCREEKSSKLILTLLNYYLSRTDNLYNAEITPRYVIPSGQRTYTAIPQVEDTLCHFNFLDTMYISIYRILYMELLGRFKNLPYMGRIYVDPIVENCTLPSKVRDQNNMAQVFGRGSEFKLTIPHDNTYEDIFVPFIHWTDMENSRVDIDLSILFVDELFEKRAVVSYTNLYLKDDSGEIIAAHSGDYVSGGPKGGEGVAERVYIRREAARACGYRYAIIQIHSFTNQTFEESDSTYFGIQYLLDAKQDSKFKTVVTSRTGFNGRTVMSIKMDPKQTVLTANLQSKSTAITAAILDLDTGMLTWADTSIQTTFSNANGKHEDYEKFAKQYAEAAQNKETMNDFRRYINNGGNNVWYTLFGSWEQFQAILQAPRITLSALLKLHCDARGALVDKPENADIIFTLPSRDVAKEAREDQTVLTPFMLDKWLGEFLPTLD